MRARLLATAVAGGLLAMAALTGCTVESSGPPAQASEANLSGEAVSVQDDMTALCEQMVAEALPLDAAVALAEASGYTTRVSSIDGQDQPTTTDLREDRFTFEVAADAVVGCTIG
jgi:hypothetical protein